MIYSKADEKRWLKVYLQDHPFDEVTPSKEATQVHHIFGKKCKETRINSLNFVALSLGNHAIAEFNEVQAFAEEIFKVKIRDHGQAFIDFANEHGGKTWRVYCERKGI